MDVSTKKHFSSWWGFFFTIGATKSHTPNHESLFQSRKRDGQHTDLLAWSSLRREPAESMMSGTRAATAALRMAIFRPLFSTLPLRCEGKRLICLSFVLKLVSRQKMIWGWSSPLIHALFFGNTIDDIFFFNHEVQLLTFLLHKRSQSNRHSLYVHFNILRGFTCRLDNLRLKFTNEPSIFAGQMGLWLSRQGGVSLFS